jgi:tRNA-specific 2-thiouridylase
VRYRDEGQAARIEPGESGTAVVRFDQPVRAVTPGQAAVFYQGATVLGGGWIASSLA